MCTHACNSISRLCHYNNGSCHYTHTQLVGLALMSTLVSPQIHHGRLSIQILRPASHSHSRPSDPEYGFEGFFSSSSAVVSFKLSSQSHHYVPQYPQPLCAVPLVAECGLFPQPNPSIGLSSSSSLVYNLYSLQSPHTTFRLPPELLSRALGSFRLLSFCLWFVSPPRPWRSFGCPAKPPLGCLMGKTRFTSSYPVETRGIPGRT